MYVDTAKYVRNCAVCQSHKVPEMKPVGLLGNRVFESPWTVVAADIVGPLPSSKSGPKFLVIIHDLFTKWVELSLLPSATGFKIKEKADQLLIAHWGTPRVIQSDNGTEFHINAIAAYKSLKIHHSFIPPYGATAYPVKRVNKVMIAA